MFPRPEDVFAAARTEFIACAHAAIAARGRFDVVLSGGRTPQSVYRGLVGADVDWSRVHAFFGDERCVPPVHTDSNYRMASEALLSRVPIPVENLHRIRGELEPERAAEEYEAEVRRTLALEPRAWPRFDLALLGMGADGHTASLFPGTTALKERRRMCAATKVEKLQAWRVTLTLPVFDNAVCVLFLVSGRDKAAMLKLATASVVTKETPPAGRVRPTSGDLLWFVDESAKNG